MDQKNIGSFSRLGKSDFGTSKSRENLYRPPSVNSFQTVQQQTSNEKPAYTKVQLVCVVVGVILSLFMVSLNSTVIAPALTKIATDLNNIQSQTWIATSYLVALNAFQPLAGRFSDIFGRKYIYLLGIAFFFIGSLINALSNTMNMLIAGRTIQGFGGGGVMSMCFIIVTDIASEELRPRFLTSLTAVYGIASVVGPLIGGAFVDNATWHWDFWLNVIFSSTSFIILVIFLKESGTKSELSFKQKLMNIDWLGSIFSISFTVCLLLALNWGDLYGWSDAHSIGPFIASGISLIGLIIVEGWIAKSPLLPPNILMNPNVALVYLYMFCLGFTFMATLYFGPIFYQAVYGVDSTASGVRLIPYMVCLIIGSIGSSIILRRFSSLKPFLIAGAMCNILGFGLFQTVDEYSNWGKQAGLFTFCGLAFGLSQQNALLIVQSVVKKEDHAIATSTNNFFMMLACSIGIAIYEVMYSSLLASQFLKLPLDVLAVANEYGALTNYLFVFDLPLAVQGPVIHAYVLALRNVFLLPIGIAAFSLIVALFIKNVRYGQEQPSATTFEDKEKEFA